jgi:hypothetical protein
MEFWSTYDTMVLRSFHIMISVEFGAEFVTIALTLKAQASAYKLRAREQLAA